MSVTSNLLKETELTWNAFNLPQNFEMVMLDVSNNRIVDVSKGKYVYKNRSEDHPNRFKVFVGTSEYTKRELEKAQADLPKEFALFPNYPNPFNPSTTINYHLASSGNVELRIYNALGQLVRTIVSNQYQETGKYSVRWDGRNAYGQQVASGIYIYRLKADGFVKSRKMMLIK